MGAWEVWKYGSVGGIRYSHSPFSFFFLGRTEQFRARDGSRTGVLGNLAERRTGRPGLAVEPAGACSIARTGDRLVAEAAKLRDEVLAVGILGARTLDDSPSAGVRFSLV